MWQGTKEEFFVLYRVASTYLKSKFPNLKIGGYGSSGMYAVFREGMNDFYKSFPIWFVEFLAMVKENDCPLDFYSWHIYTDKLSEVVASADYVRKTLDEYGFTETESHLNEWNYGAEGKQFEDKDTMVGATFCAAAFALMQSGSVDLAQYYVATQPSVYNGLLYMRSSGLTPVAHAFAAFNKLFRAEDALEISVSQNDPYAIAASDSEGKIYALISNYRLGDGEFTLEMPGRDICVSVLSDGGFSELCQACEKVTLPLSDYTVYLVESSVK